MPPSPEKGKLPPEYQAGVLGALMLSGSMMTWSVGVIAEAAVSFVTSVSPLLPAALGGGAVLLGQKEDENGVKRYKFWEWM